MAAPSSKHNKDPEAKIEIKSKLKYNLEENMSIEQIGKEFEVNKDQIKNNIMKTFLLFIPMIVSIDKQSLQEILVKNLAMALNFPSSIFIIHNLFIKKNLLVYKFIKKDIFIIYLIY